MHVPHFSIFSIPITLCISSGQQAQRIQVPSRGHDTAAPLRPNYVSYTYMNNLRIKSPHWQKILQDLLPPKGKEQQAHERERESKMYTGSCFCSYIHAYACTYMYVYTHVERMKAKLYVYVCIVVVHIHLFYNLFVARGQGTFLSTWLQTDCRPHASIRSFLSAPMLGRTHEQGLDSR